MDRLGQANCHENTEKSDYLRRRVQREKRREGSFTGTIGQREIEKREQARHR